MSGVMARLGFWLLERAGALHRESCRAYGGCVYDGDREFARICLKHRWHWDSHVYEPDYGQGRYEPK